MGIVKDETDGSFSGSAKYVTEFVSCPSVLDHDRTMADPTPVRVQHP